MAIYHYSAGVDSRQREAWRRDAERRSAKRAAMVSAVLGTALTILAAVALSWLTTNTDAVQTAEMPSVMAP